MLSLPVSLAPIHSSSSIGGSESDTVFAGRSSGNDFSPHSSSIPEVLLIPSSALPHSSTSIEGSDSDNFV
ncbi:hypothetical protein MTR67_033915, partial [Solanum verrucosum]